MSYNLKILYIIIFLFSSSCTLVEGQRTLNECIFEEEGFSVRFLDATATEDGGVLFSGRIETGDYITHKKLYGYDSKKYPEYIRNGANGKKLPSTILHKIDEKGDSLWTKLYPFSLQGTAITASGDGGFVITGFEPTDREKAYENDKTQVVTCIKVDENGQIEWQKRIPSNYNSVSKDVILSKGNIIILAEHEYPPINDVTLNPSLPRLIKIDQKGKLISDKTIPLIKGRAIYFLPKQVLENEDGDIFVVGTSSSNNNSVFVAKIDTSDRIIKTKEYNWEKKYGNEYNWCFSATLVSDGLVFSASAYQGKNEGQYLIKVNKNLEKEWEVIQSCNPTDQSRLTSNSDDEIYLLANTESDQVLVAKYSRDGDLVW